MIKIFLIALWLPLSLSLKCDISGECTQSYLVTGLVTGNQIACLEKCRENTRANWYTFRQDIGFCELFEDCTIIEDEDCKDCVSGEAKCPTYQCGLSGLCEVVFLKIS
jgi:hypothetical protein